MLPLKANRKGNTHRRIEMELAPKTAVQIFFVVLVAVVFIAFGKSYSNDTVSNTTTTTNGLWEDVTGASQPTA